MSQTLSSRRQTTDTAAADTRPTLLFFFSPTSGASRRADGFLAQVLQRRGNHSTFRLVRVDADQRPDLVERLQISEVPTLLVVAEGRIGTRISKPSGCIEISQLLSPWLR
jgi:thioredoxin-like negative regulator of GroEL